jgi:hypothetical protein
MPAALKRPVDTMSDSHPRTPASLAMPAALKRPVDTMSDSHPRTQASLAMPDSLMSDGRR